MGACSYAALSSWIFFFSSTDDDQPLPPLPPTEEEAKDDRAPLHDDASKKEKKKKKKEKKRKKTDEEEKTVPFSEDVQSSGLRTCWLTPAATIPNATNALSRACPVSSRTECALSTTAGSLGEGDQVHRVRVTATSTQGTSCPPLRP